MAAAAFVAWTGLGMPELVAAKFGTHGELGGWVHRRAYIASAAFLVLVLPMLVVMWPPAMVRKGKSWAKVPHAEHWLQPERRSEAASMLKEQLQEVGVMLIAYQAYRHWLIVEAHAMNGRALDVHAAMVSIVVLVVGVGLWVLMRYWLWTPVEGTAEGA